MQHAVQYTAAQTSNSDTPLNAAQDDRTPGRMTDYIWRSRFTC